MHCEGARTHGRCPALSGPVQRHQSPSAFALRVYASGVSRLSSLVSRRISHLSSLVSPCRQLRPCCCAQDREREREREREKQTLSLRLSVSLLLRLSVPLSLTHTHTHTHTHSLSLSHIQNTGLSNSMGMAALVSNRELLAFYSFPTPACAHARCHAMHDRCPHKRSHICTQRGLRHAVRVHMLVVNSSTGHVCMRVSTCACMCICRVPVLNTYTHRERESARARERERERERESERERERKRTWSLYRQQRVGGARLDQASRVCLSLLALSRQTPALVLAACVRAFA